MSRNETIEDNQSMAPSEIVEEHQQMMNAAADLPAAVNTCGDDDDGNELAGDAAEGDKKKMSDEKREEKEIIMPQREVTLTTPSFEPMPLEPELLASLEAMDPGLDPDLVAFREKQDGRMLAVQEDFKQQIEDTGYASTVEVNDDEDGEEDDEYQDGDDEYEDGEEEDENEDGDYDDSDSSDAAENNLEGSRRRMEKIKIPQREVDYVLSYDPETEAWLKDFDPELYALRERDQRRMLAKQEDFKRQIRSKGYVSMMVEVFTDDDSSYNFSDSSDDFSDSDEDEGEDRCWIM